VFFPFLKVSLAFKLWNVHTIAILLELLELGIQLLHLCGESLLLLHTALTHQLDLLG